MRDSSLEELLEILSGSIVASRRHQHLIRALLAGPAGRWRAVMELDASDLLAEEARAFSAELGPHVVEGLKLAWTLNPDDPEDETFRAILFFYGRDALMWNCIALFNRHTLDGDQRA
ncbi:hypothetical protein P2318_33355 [Myxococcaceae bacterium GXIMD 01537]